jgi:hypothetical protein
VWETSGRLASEDPFSEPFLTTKVVPAEAFLEKQELTKQEVLSPGQKKAYDRRKMKAQSLTVFTGK